MSDSAYGFENVMVPIGWVLDWKRLGLGISDINVLGAMLEYAAKDCNGRAVTYIDADDINGMYPFTNVDSTIEKLENLGVLERPDWRRKCYIMPDRAWGNEC